MPVPTRTTNRRIDLSKYCFIAGSSVTMTLLMMDGRGNTIESPKTVTVTATSGSLPKLFDDGSLDWFPNLYRQAHVLNVSGSIYFNTAGNGDITVNNGVTVGYEPVAAGSGGILVEVGMVFGGVP